jgi:putative SOS response-associated peptidase YedK
MCGRYYRRSDKQRIAEAFHAGQLPEDFVLPEWDYNVAPATFQPVVRNTKDNSQREVTLMRWGLIPFFTKQLNDVKGLSTINARAESLAKSATWSNPARKRRCLVPADGFYEWKKIDTRTKQPYAFHIRNDEPFAFAGLWDAWKDSNGQWLLSFGIITTVANELMRAVHDRMPVILHHKDYDRWLDRSELRPPLDLLQPFPSERMEAAPCNRAVGNVKNNGPEMLNSA